MLSAWEKHYTRKKSTLSYPDENLVRLLSGYIRENPLRGDEIAIDLGCGSGRHLTLLNNLSFNFPVGTDGSLQALENCLHLSHSLTNCHNSAIPFRNETADIVISWGSLHYNHKDELPGMISEILRILKPGGKLFATLRSDRDTYLKRGKHIENNVWQTDLSDLQGSVASFFREDELPAIFHQFSESSYGIIERSIIGDTGSIISHWVISAEK